MRSVHNRTNASLSTFGIDGDVRHIQSIDSKNQIPSVVEQAKELGLPIRPVGEGSNTVLAATEIDRFLVDINISGRKIVKESDESVWIQAGAGENWDGLVADVVDAGWSGISALSAIPGSVGAAPVQNIGAYGQELSEVLESVKVFDTQKESVRSLDVQECDFGYRTSRFKQNPGRFVILSVTLKLSKLPPAMPEYKDVEEFFEERSVVNPSLKQIRAAVKEIRWSKLPRPEKTPNVGSFFKNPVVSKREASNLQNKYPNMPTYEQGDKAKIAAGWLIEEVGLKGEQCGSVGTSEKSALILISNNEAKFSDLAELIGKIRHKVREGFGVELEREPRILF